MLSITAKPRSFNSPTAPGLLPIRDQPIQPTQSKGKTTKSQERLPARCGVIQQDELPRENDDRDKHDDANLHGTRPLPNCQNDRMIEFEQNNDGEYQAERVLHGARFHIEYPCTEVVRQGNYNQYQRINDDY